ncbi:hypothetical protein IFR04_008178 [Cadophora malorum]|uniref:Uncharacterized protein n=1 Tax=Cadophora malorum TaxID=108018 RepID=A0A8H7TFD9_9HELO|nr:hypothetical protein IFR04_008178 [Cadophora malorum]
MASTLTSSVDLEKGLPHDDPPESLSVEQNLLLRILYFESEAKIQVVRSLAYFMAGIVFGLFLSIATDLVYLYIYRNPLTPSLKPSLS